MFDASNTQLLRLYKLMLIDDLVMARITIPCLGQVLNLFRTDASKILYPEYPDDTAVFQAICNPFPILELSAQFRKKKNSAQN